MPFMGKPKKLIKSTTEGMIGSGSTEVPFSNYSVYIACEGEGVSDCFLRKWKSETRFFIFGTCGVEFMAEAGSILTGKKARSRRATIRGGDIALSKPDPFFSNGINMRGGNFLVSLAS